MPSSVWTRTRNASWVPSARAVSTCGRRSTIGSTSVIFIVDSRALARKHAPSTEAESQGWARWVARAGEHRDEPGQGSRDDAARRAGRPRHRRRERHRPCDRGAVRRGGGPRRRGRPRGDPGPRAVRPSAALGSLGHTGARGPRAPRRRRPSGRSTSSSTMPASSCRRWPSIWTSRAMARCSPSTCTPPCSSRAARRAG